MYLLLSLFNNPPSGQKVAFNALLRAVNEYGRQRLGDKYTLSLDPPFKPCDTANAIHGLRANGSQEKAKPVDKALKQTKHHPRNRPRKEAALETPW
ncbi:hypothetical protein ColTof4_14333 [Colletotrichum tofieldiae]|nr:hypothetical protein ColTof4_14333 [Colletotrichum tofieldiae]